MALIVVATSAPAVAEACCDRVAKRHRDRAVRVIRRAQIHFDAGRYRRARAMLERTNVPIRSPRLERRRMEIIAVANIRTGRVSAGVAAIRRLLEDRPGDPYLLTRLAEGLASYRSPGAKRRALRLLNRLDERGLIADQRGRRLRASLRTASHRSSDAD